MVLPTEQDTNCLFSIAILWIYNETVIQGFNQKKQDWL